MGKAGRWLRSFFAAGRKGRRAREKADADAQSVSSSAPPSTREKRRWSFRRISLAPAAGRADAGQSQLASSVSRCFSEAEVRVAVAHDDQRTAVPEAAAIPAPAPETERTDGGAQEAAAAIRIQSAFRSYLARKALCALRGMVQLQAMVRGQLVRRQASTTLRRMQALVDAQRRARAERLRLLEDAGVEIGATPRPPPSRRSPRHPRARRREPAEREENAKIVEVDDGGGGGEAHGPTRAGARRGGGSFHSTPAKAELTCQQKVSPTASASALTEGSPRTLSGRFDDVSVTSASEPGRRHRAAGGGRPWHGESSFPSYMANTQSSRARARSQSAPRQRPAAAASEPASAAASAWASPSPSCGERTPSAGSGGAHRRASLDPLDLPGARSAAAPRRAAARMERCASRSRAAGAAVPGSECGSSCTVVTAAVAAAAAARMA
ncbi:hypothetical protein ACP4OV_022931 [Aristida adscensionis]